jgi:protein-export membrane protein SecD/preprotein translocase SecF subunit
MKSIRWRLVIIGALLASSVFFLLPRNVKQRVYDPALGQMRDSTVRRVPISLGLDLRGGIHLALEVDESRGQVADCADAIQRAERIVRTRINEFGTAEPVVQIEGRCRLIVELPGVEDPARARAIVQRSAFLEFRLTDSENRFGDALPAMDERLRRTGATGAAADSGRGEPNEVARLLGLQAVDSAGQPGATTGGPLSSLLLPGNVPGAFVVLESDVAAVERLLASPEVGRLMPRGIELRWSSATEGPERDRYRALYALQARPIITGEDLRSATADRDPMTQQPGVQFELTRRAGTRFAETTGRNVGRNLAILLDGSVQGPPPVIQERISTTGRISLDGRTFEEASDLALVLRAGSLPAPLRVVEESAIGPSLGADSIRDGVRASLVAVLFVVMVMGVYYRVSGWLAVGALGLYVAFTLGGLAAFGFTLSLPGLAGFALSIGMAVDANVLIFERMREELALGKPARTAVNEGFRHAMSAIIDSNVTTALTALILYLVGTGPVQGFAITLLVGIAASMLSAIFVTRTFFLIWLERRRVAATLRYRTLSFFSRARWDFIALRRRAYALSALFILPGLLLLALRGATYSIEFTGGALIQIETTQPVGTAAVRSALEAGALGAAEIQSYGSDRGFVIRARLDEEGAGEGDLPAITQAVRTALDAGLGAGSYRVQRAEAVGPKVGQELQQKATIAILFSFITTLLYLAVRFEWRFGLAAVLATAHDIFATLAFIAYLDLEVSLVVVAAVLTVVGYSLNDTIVIFDRVRENLQQQRRRPLREVLNQSITETLPRTLLTGGTTVATGLVLSFFAGEVIRPFALVMTFGIIVGTLSSIFVASPLLLRIARDRLSLGTRGRRPVPRAATQPDRLTPALPEPGG